MQAACSGGTEQAGGSDPQTLTLASVDQGSVEDVVKAFEAANPGVHVRCTTSSADQYQQQIRTQLSSGTAPDVMSAWTGNGNPAATHVLAEPGYLRAVPRRRRRFAISLQPVASPPRLSGRASEHYSPPRLLRPRTRAHSPSTSRRDPHRCT
ncbi:extracellular solute-binding protein [Streptomyces sp. NPDC102462]|uniref:extracellular solute-binding protein n=1 Tax=Streptomyces sp. NPDC102462 TaxID=3366178 RepID=UPI0038133B66